MRNYELVFITHPELGEDEMAAVTDRITGLIERNSGQVTQVNPWGMRRLAYPIQDQREGQYVLMHFDMEPSGVAELENDIVLIEDVMRHLVVRVE